MKIAAEFVTSAAIAADFPRDGTPQVALVGRSNVGKSSLINALVRRGLARTSAAPGKTRLANIYRVARAPRHARGALSPSKGGSARPLYLVDLPGYGYARGGAQSAREFEELARAYFGQTGQTGPLTPSDRPARRIAAILLVDSRHPGLETDISAWGWMRETVASHAIAATKIDKIGRAERARNLRQLESVFEEAVLPVSAVTGEGLDELWKLIDRLANSSNPRPRSQAAMAALPRKRKR